MTAKKKKFTLGQTKRMLPFVKEFNKLSKLFIDSLQKKIQAKERRLNKISVIISDVYIPETAHNISIRTVDMKKTKINKRGKGSYNQPMAWEKELQKNRKKWII